MCVRVYSESCASAQQAKCTCLCPRGKLTYTHCALLAGIKYAKACLQRDKRGEQIALCLPTSACALESSRHFLHCGARFLSFSLSKTPNSWTPLFTQRNALHARAHTVFYELSLALSLSQIGHSLCMLCALENCLRL
jgi:hypothetical protein